MNFGEKFPYALLTFSQKFVEAGYWGYTFSQKFVEAAIGGTPLPQKLVRLIVPRTHTSPKSLSKLVIGYTTPQSLPARPAPHQLPYPTPQT